MLTLILPSPPLLSLLLQAMLDSARLTEGALSSASKLLMAILLREVSSTNLLSVFKVCWDSGVRSVVCVCCEVWCIVVQYGVVRLVCQMSAPTVVCKAP